jgi:hypothetical protein
LSIVWFLIDLLWITAFFPPSRAGPRVLESSLCFCAVFLSTETSLYADIRSHCGRLCPGRRVVGQARFSYIVATMGWSEVSGFSPPEDIVELISDSDPGVLSDRDRSRSPRLERHSPAAATAGLPSAAVPTPRVGTVARPQHVPTAGTEWWAVPLLTSVAHLRDRLPEANAPFVIESACSGAFSEGFICQVRGPQTIHTHKGG